MTYSEQFVYITNNFGGNYRNQQVRLGFTVGGHAEKKLVYFVSLSWEQNSEPELFSSNSIEDLQSVLRDCEGSWEDRWFEKSNPDAFINLALVCPNIQSLPQQELYDLNITFEDTFVHNLIDHSI